MENETNPTQEGVAAESGENFTDVVADNPNATELARDTERRGFAAVILYSIIKVNVLHRNV